MAALGAGLAWTPGARAAGIFDPWQAYAYIQSIGLTRPQGLLPAGALDDQGHQAAGLDHDGLFVQKMEARLWGPLGPEGWAMTLGTQTDLVSGGITDAYAQWSSASGAWRVQAGQERLPFGAEEQTSSARLLEVQRGLAYGFANYGHSAAWGLGILAERGDGLRVDLKEAPADWLSLALQSGVFLAGGNGFNPGPAAALRASIKLGSQAWGLELGASGHASRATLILPSETYLPLGAQPGSPWETAAGSGAKANILTWGQDARLDLGALHLSGEAAFQSLDGLTRGGGKLSAACDVPLLPGRPFSVYGSADQASANFGDGVHRPGSLYRLRTLGFFSPLPWGSGLKLEALQFSGDDFPGVFPGGQIYQAQWQIEL
jgi:hypothetical protein